MKNEIKVRTQEFEDDIRCGDGRHGVDARIAQFGGDMNLVLALISLNKKYDWKLSPESIVNSVLGSLKKINSRLFLHSDEHSHPKGFKKNAEKESLIGCGHLAKAATIDHSHKYDTPIHDVCRAVHYLHHLIDQGEKNISVDILEGHHEERAVIINTGIKKTIVPTDNSQFFRWDIEKSHDRIKKIVKNLSLPNGVKVDNDEIIKISDEQTMQTAEILASKLEKITLNADTMPRTSILSLEN
jgi:hypothetical protein